MRVSSVELGVGGNSVIQIAKQKQKGERRKNTDIITSQIVLVKEAVVLFLVGLEHGERILFGFTMASRH